MLCWRRPDIVPIGGLVLNNFHRQWNELKTVIELWGNRELPSPPLKSSSSQEISNPANGNNNNANGNTNNHNNSAGGKGEKDKRGGTVLHQKVLENDFDAVMDILSDDTSRYAIRFRLWINV